MKAEFKYVMFTNDTFIVLPNTENHSEVLRLSTRNNINSAGFVNFYFDATDGGMKAECYGYSGSLSTLENKVSVDKDHDEEIFNRYMKLQGLL